MPIDPDDIDSLPTYTTAQRLKMYRKAEMDILAAGQSYSVEDRQKMSAQLSEIRQAIKDLEAELANEDSTFDNGFGLIEFGQD
jgi:hypothetical protein